MAKLEDDFRRAVDAFQTNKLDLAEKILKQIDQSKKNIFDVHHLLGVIMLMQERFPEAESWLRKAVAVNRQSDEALSDYGYALMNTNKPREALDWFGKALSINPRNVLARQHAGTVLTDYLANFSEAVVQFDNAIALVPNFPFAYVGKGFALSMLGRDDEAIASFDKALSIEPKLEKAWLGRGNVFVKRGRYDEAIAAYDKALAIKPDLEGAWLGRGNVFYNLKRYNEALTSYDKALSFNPNLGGASVGRGNVLLEFKRSQEAAAAFDRALSAKPDLVEAWIGHGNLALALNQLRDAMTAFDKALSVSPASAEAWLGRGNVLLELKQHDGAVAAFDKALLTAPQLAEAWLGRGHACSNLKRYDEAYTAYDKAFSIEPDMETVEGARLHLKMQLCNWENLDREIESLSQATSAGKSNSTPFALLSLIDSPDLHRRCAETWVRAKHPENSEPQWRGKIYAHDKIRIGYVSADLHEHATAYLMAELFELHDKERYSISAFSLGGDDGSAMRQRLVRSFDRFVDCSQLSDAEIATAISEAEIDILVDLKGFTKGARTNIFAARAAPVQVNYLGYPGTMGAPYIDYVVGDKTIFGLADAQCFTEKLVMLPDSYQPNDRKRPAPSGSFTREQLGLPDGAFVYCCFNNNFKISPHVFDIWMRILRRVETSVLWLFLENDEAERNLKREAELRGVEPGRLVFAREMAFSDHMARHRLADLFLDTLPYNAHTTASDALWAGLPVLTRRGHAFPGRVAASLLNAIGLPELVTSTADEYESLAVDLALDSNKLSDMRKKLARNISETPLFDAPLYTRNLEAAFEEMYRRYKQRLPPDHIDLRS